MRRIQSLSYNDNGAILMFGNDYVKVSLCSVLASKPGQCSGWVSCRRSRLQRSRPVLSECAKLLERRRRRQLRGGRLFISFSTAKREPEKIHTRERPAQGRGPLQRRAGGRAFRVLHAHCMDTAWTLRARCVHTACTQLQVPCSTPGCSERP